MTTYKKAGVDIALGDESSRLAYQAAMKTFPSRKGMIGEPVVMEDGFSGMLNMGEFYLTQNDDGIGTKMLIAEAIDKYDTAGYDLLAMVVDDAVCLGAEVVSVSNTLDIPKVDPKVIKELLKGLSKAAREQKIVIPGGEIAELGKMVSGLVWNATAVGVVEKNKVITGKDIQVGDKIIGLKSNLLRSNGFSLVRYILQKKFGKNWAHKKYDKKRTWGEVMIMPSKIYHAAVLEMHGRFGEPSQVELKGVVHVTGGGIPGNIKRILKPLGHGARLDNLLEPQEPVLRLQELGNVSDEEAYKTWNMGVGMILVCNDYEKVSEIAQEHKIETEVMGVVTGTPEIHITNKGFFKKKDELIFK